MNHSWRNLDKKSCSMVRLRHRNIIRKIKEYQIIDIAQALHNTPPLSFISFFIILRNNQLSRIKTIYLFSTEILILKIFQRNIPFSFFQIFLASSKKKKKKERNDNCFTGRLKRKLTLSLLERVTRREEIQLRSGTMGWEISLKFWYAPDEAKESTKAARLKIARNRTQPLLQRAELRRSRTTVQSSRKPYTGERRQSGDATRQHFRLSLRLFAVTSLPSSLNEFCSQRCFTNVLKKREKWKETFIYRYLFI